MPAPKKKRFIDKKNAITFRLVSRSQKDPLAADETAPQHVLLEQILKPISRKDGRTTSQSVDGEHQQKRKEEQRKYGIFFDDDYNYLQHLKGGGEVTLEPIGRFAFHRLEDAKNKHSESKVETKLNLPSSVFASDVEEKVGLLNRAAPVRGPQPDLDPDIVAILDSDCEDDIEDLEDDFVIKANALEDDNRMDDTDDQDSFIQENEDDYQQCGSDFEDGQHSFNDEETKSRFTNYSLSSSVIRRSEGLVLLDDRFEKIFEEYDEDCIGALDGEDIDGFLKSGDPLFESVIENFKTKQMEDSGASNLNNLEWHDSSLTKGTVNDDEELERLVIEEPDEKWDCESILSTYSNIYNRPKLIKEPPKFQIRPIKISSKTGIPVGVLRSSGFTAADLKTLDEENGVLQSCPSVRSFSSCVSKRCVGETPEEKRQRKQVVKQQRRERRAEKKANTMAFKEEKKRQVKVMLNLQKNLNGIKLN